MEVEKRERYRPKYLVLPSDSVFAELNEGLGLAPYSRDRSLLGPYHIYAFSAAQVFLPYLSMGQIPHISQGPD